MVEKLKSLLLCAILSGLFIKNSECRVVNLQNAWTLPQEDFSVFYRYFRDKISWYEADAVCQFHHADLVTIDNVVKFDAVRAYLKELDVTLSVWIGLRRQDNLHRFLWTNLKELDQFNSYWANELPIMEEPLCALVDPISGYRWQAVRCGGPESAGFLCELPVPQWATECTELSMLPSLTMQYLADSAVVQISRDCGELGTRNVTCSGKEDHKNMLEQLQCTDHENITLTDMNESKNTAAKIISKSIENILTNKLNDESSAATINVKALDSLDQLKSQSADSRESIYSVAKDKLYDVTKLTDISIANLNNKMLMDEKETLEYEEMRKSRAKSIFDLDDLMQGDQFVEHAHHPPMIAANADERLEESTTTPYSVEHAHHPPMMGMIAANAEEPHDDSNTTHHPPMVAANAEERHDGSKTTHLYEPSDTTMHTTETASTAFVVETTTVLNNKTMSNHILHNPQIYLRDQHKDVTTKSYDDQEGVTLPQQNNNDHFIPPMMLVKAKYTTVTKPPSIATISGEEVTQTTLSSGASEKTVEPSADETITTENMLNSSPSSTHSEPTEKITSLETTTESVSIVSTTAEAVVSTSESKIVKRENRRFFYIDDTQSFWPSHLETAILK